MEPTDSQGELTPKQQLFVKAYARCLNATKAALAAEYSPETARQMGYENLTKPYIQDAIAELLKNRLMPADEATKRLSDIASTRLNDYMTVQQVQGYEQVPAYLSVLVEKKQEEIEFIQEFASRQGLPLFDSEGGMTAMGKRLTKAREELLSLELEKRAHGPDAVKLVAGKPIIFEMAELDLVAIARADEQGLLKSFKHTKEGIAVETYAVDSALRDILKLHGKFVERTDITSGGKAITATVEIIASGPPLASSEKEIDDAL